MAFRIKTVSKRTGIPKSTLIAWERRHGVPAPERTPAGYRVYSADDVALIERLQALLAQGLQIGEAVQLVTGPARAPVRQVSTLERAREAILDRLLAMDAPGADQAAQVLAAMPFEDALLEVYLPVMRQIGDRWEDGTATVVQEHHASAWCRDRILAMLRQVGGDRAIAPSAVLATPPNERHELGLLAVAVRLALRGYRIVYLGADVPIDELCAWLATSPPRLVCLSLVLERPVDEVREIARRIAAAAPGAVVLLGGPATVALIDERTPRIRYGATIDDVEALELV